MADLVFNIAKGAAAEKIRDGATNVGVLILATTGLEADAGLRDRITLQDLLVTGTSKEPTNAGYARKTGLTATLTVDQAADLAKLSIPNQTWTAVAAGSGWSKLVIYYDEVPGTPSDTTRVPLSAHDFVVTPDGSDITAQIAAAGFYQAA